MKQFLDRVILKKSGYDFPSSLEPGLRNFFISEIIFHLKDCENQWLNLNQKTLESNPDDKKLIAENFLLMHQLKFRFDEIVRFINKCSGPRIIAFAASELSDLIKEKIYINSLLSGEEFEKGTIIIVVLSTYFQPEIYDLQIMKLEEISQPLQAALSKLRNRF